ncbi:unnamed protein product [Caenorhabditis sp. 36 PRJEB53466]|nr:unnamed protein product [Caenorhabditis sp. 36 PRJEB53466]
MTGEDDQKESQKDTKVEKDKSKKADTDEAESEASKVPITIDPEEAKVPSAGGKSEHMVVNFTAKRMAFKVRCGNTLFRVEPTHMIVEPGKCRQLTITRSAGPMQTDKAIVQYIEIEKDSQDPKAAFKAAEEAKAKIPHIRIKLVAAATGSRKLSREVLDE